MLDLEQLQILAQITDSTEILTEKLEKAYANNDREEFNKFKGEILKNQKKISEIIG